MDSGQLIREIKDGKVAAFKLFFESFYPALCQFANRYLNNRDTSFDICQDGFVYLWNKIEDVDSIDSAKSYLFKYVKNRSLNYIRDHENRMKLNFDSLDSGIFFRDNLIETEIYSEIYTAIRNLSPQGRKIIELSLDGFKNQEIADQLQISVNTVKTLKQRAFESLRHDLKENVFILFGMSWR